MSAKDADESDKASADAAGDYPANHFVPGPNVVVRSVIGRGGHATVYEAELSSIRKTVALKVLHEFHKHDPQLAERIVEEGRTLAQLDHPNIVSVLNAGFTEDDRKLAWIMLERLRGANGRAILEKKKRLSIVNALEMLIPLAKALQLAHEHGIIHQDLKPENIFIHQQAHDAKTITKLCDFSIQRRFSTSEGGTPAEPSFEGTLAYAAPEQIIGGRVTTRTDIYAFGIVLFEYLTGVRPFHEAEERDQKEMDGLDSWFANASAVQRSWIVNAKLADDSPPRLHLHGLYPRALESLISACLARDPEKRQRSMGEIVRELTSILQNLAPEFRTTRQTTEDLLSTAVREATRTKPLPTPPAAAEGDARPAASPLSRASEPPSALDWKGGTVRLEPQIAPQMPPAQTPGTFASVLPQEGSDNGLPQRTSPGVRRRQGWIVVGVAVIFGIAVALLVLTRVRGTVSASVRPSVVSSAPASSVQPLPFPSDPTTTTAAASLASSPASLPSPAPTTSTTTTVAASAPPKKAARPSKAPGDAPHTPGGSPPTDMDTDLGQVEKRPAPPAASTSKSKPKTNGPKIEPF